MAHWSPKDSIDRVDDQPPIQLLVGRTNAKPVAAYRDEDPTMITRSNDYIGVPKVATDCATTPLPVTPSPNDDCTAPTPVTAPGQHTNTPKGQQPIMSNHDQTPCQPVCHNHAPHPWYGGQPHAYAAQPLVVQQMPQPGHNVQTGKPSDVRYTKGVLMIGDATFDLTGEMLGSHEFKAKLTEYLQAILATDLNVQAALLTPSEKRQDAALVALEAMDKALKHAIQCAYYEDGDLVFPGLKNDCGKDARVKIPPVNAVSYDVATETLHIGSAAVKLPVAAMVSRVINQALNAASASLPKVKTAKEITDVPVFDKNNECAPARSAGIDQLADAILTEGIPALCEQNKLMPIEEPTRLLTFGKKCRDFGITSLEQLMLQMAKFLPLAKPGEFPIEVRGWGEKEGMGEKRYPVKVKPYEVQANNGAVIMAGNSAEAPVKSNRISVTAKEGGVYLITGMIRGAINVGIGGTPDKGHSGRQGMLFIGDTLIGHQGDTTYYDQPSMLDMNVTISALAFVSAGQVISVEGTITGSGQIETVTGVGYINALKLGMTELAINAAV